MAIVLQPWLSWLGHTPRVPDDRLPKKLWSWVVALKAALGCSARLSTVLQQ